MQCRKRTLVSRTICGGMNRPLNGAIRNRFACSTRGFLRKMNDLGDLKYTRAPSACGGAGCGMGGTVVKAGVKRARRRRGGGGAMCFRVVGPGGGVGGSARGHVLVLKFGFCAVRSWNVGVFGIRRVVKVSLLRSSGVGRARRFSALTVPSYSYGGPSGPEGPPVIGWIAFSDQGRGAGVRAFLGIVAPCKCRSFGARGVGRAGVLGPDGAELLLWRPIRACGGGRGLRLHSRGGRGGATSPGLPPRSFWDGGGVGSGRGV